MRALRYRQEGQGPGVSVPPPQRGEIEAIIAGFPNPVASSLDNGGHRAFIGAQGVAQNAGQNNSQDWRDGPATLIEDLSTSTLVNALGRPGRVVNGVGGRVRLSTDIRVAMNKGEGLMWLGQYNPLKVTREPARDAEDCVSMFGNDGDIVFRFITLVRGFGGRDDGAGEYEGDDTTGVTYCTGRQLFDHCTLFGGTDGVFDIANYHSDFKSNGKWLFNPSRTSVSSCIIGYALFHSDEHYPRAAHAGQSGIRGRNMLINGAYGQVDIMRCLFTQAAGRGVALMKGTGTYRLVDCVAFGAENDRGVLDTAVVDDTSGAVGNSYIYFDNLVIPPSVFLDAAGQRTSATVRLGVNASTSHDAAVYAGRTRSTLSGVARDTLGVDGDRVRFIDGGGLESHYIKGSLGSLRDAARRLAPDPFPEISRIDDLNDVLDTVLLGAGSIRTNVERAVVNIVRTNSGWTWSPKKYGPGTVGDTSGVRIPSDIADIEAILGAPIDDLTLPETFVSHSKATLSPTRYFSSSDMADLGVSENRLYETYPGTPYLYADVLDAVQAARAERFSAANVAQPAKVYGGTTHGRNS